MALSTQPWLPLVLTQASRQVERLDFCLVSGSWAWDFPSPVLCLISKMDTDQVCVSVSSQYVCPRGSEHRWPVCVGGGGLRGGRGFFWIAMRARGWEVALGNRGAR